MKFKLFCFAFLLVFGCAVRGFTKGSAAPRAKKGVMDLRGFDFDKAIPLDGEWVFFWNKFVMPGDTQATSRFYVNFPAKWTDLSIGGRKLPSFGYATYQLNLLLPREGKVLRIALPDMYSAYNLYLNGALVAKNGVVANNPNDFEPQWKYQAFDIPKDMEKAELTLHVANFVHSKGGIKEQIIIGEKSNIQLERRQTEAIDLLLSGCLFMGGLFFLGLFLMGNRDKAVLLFSLYSLVYCYRIMGVGNYVLHTILPNIDWTIAVHLEYLSLFIGIGLFCLYTLYLYPEDVSKKIVWVLCAICGLFALFTLVLSPYYFSQLIDPFLVVTVFCIVYYLYIYLKAYFNKRPGASYAIISAFGLMITFSIILLNYWGLTPDLQLLTFFGYVSFFFFQSLILSHRVSFQLKQSRLQAEQGLKAKSEFLSTMSHEIRTPLNSVIGISHLLLKNDPREDQIEQLDIMLFSANNLLGIVNDILDYNKIEAGKIELDYVEMDISAIIRNIVSGLQNNAIEKGIALSFEIDPSFQYKVLGDSIRMFQVVTNLVHNAIKFTHHGKVKVILKVLEQSETEVSIRMEVSDTGIGISKAKQAIIFERFTQADSSTSRSFGGTGLGLAISKRILELQHSSLKVSSEEGKGSTFYFIQQFQKTQHKIETTRVIAKANKEEDKPFLGVSILLVEDNAINVMVAQSFLKNWGAIVDVAHDGEQAIKKLDIHKHQLILMDLHMPVMDGYEASKKIRAMNCHIPIVALTANLKKDIEIQINEAGINDVIVKPFLPEELYQKIKRYTS